MSTELMALGNRRPALRAEIAEATERIRKAQLEALMTKYGDNAFLDNRFSPEAMVLLLTGIPKYRQPRRRQSTLTWRIANSSKRSNNILTPSNQKLGLVFT